MSIYIKKKWYSAMGGLTSTPPCIHGFISLYPVLLINYNYYNFDKHNNYQ